MESICLKTECDIVEYKPPKSNALVTLNLKIIEKESTANDEEIPEESGSKSCTQSRYDVSPSRAYRPFEPGANEERALPDTPGSHGCSKRTLEKSIQLQKPGMMLQTLRKKRSGFSTGFEEEIKKCELVYEELRESSSSSTSHTKAAAYSDINVNLNFTAALCTKEETEESFNTPTKTTSPSVSNVRKNLLLNT